MVVSCEYVQIFHASFPLLLSMRVCPRILCEYGEVLHASLCFKGMRVWIPYPMRVWHVGSCEFHTDVVLASLCFPFMRVWNLKFHASMKQVHASFHTISCEYGI